jgi:hypothetical protein
VLCPQTRWYQLGAFQPFFRGHAHLDAKRREPWYSSIDDATLHSVRPFFAVQFNIHHNVCCWCTFSKYASQGYLASRTRARFAMRFVCDTHICRSGARCCRSFVHVIAIEPRFVCLVCVCVCVCRYTLMAANARDGSAPFRPLCAYQLDLARGVFFFFLVAKVHNHAMRTCAQG